MSDETRTRDVLEEWRDLCAKHQALRRVGRPEAVPFMVMDSIASRLASEVERKNEALRNAEILLHEAIPRAEAMEAEVARLRARFEGGVKGWAHERMARERLPSDVGPRTGYFYESTDEMVPGTKLTEGLVRAVLIFDTPRVEVEP